LLYNGMLILTLLVALVVGGVLGFIVKQQISRKKLESCENLSARIIDESKKEAENIKKEAILQAKENLLKVKTEFEKDTRDRKSELDTLERRLRSKEENFERRTDLLSQKETAIENREKAILHRESQLNEKHERADRLLEEQKVKLEQIAGITSEEAKNFLIQSMEAAAKRDAALMIGRSRRRPGGRPTIRRGRLSLMRFSATQVIMWRKTRSRWSTFPMMR